MNRILRSPDTDKEWQAYFYFRWQLLREPWQQPPGTEKDEHEQTAQHVFALDDKHQIMAVGRLHVINEHTGQLRYMAVRDDVRGQGIGRDILAWLEARALDAGLSELLLHARENAVGFYLSQGYRRAGESHTLFGTIKHTTMTKTIST